MEDNLMNIHVSDFRAIRDADIVLDGITVVSGINGCGKSTLSRLIYDTIQGSSNYESLIKNRLNAELSTTRRALNSLLHEIDHQRENTGYTRKNFSLRANEQEDLHDVEDRLCRYIKIIQDYIISTFENPDDDLLKDSTLIKDIRQRMKVRRLQRIIQSLVNEKETETSSILDLLQSLQERITAVFKRSYKAIDNRPISYFTKNLSAAYQEDITKKFELQEFGLPITDWENQTLMSTHWIQSCYYIDTPVILNMEDCDDPYWNDLLRALRDKDKSLILPDEFELINGVIAGEVFYDEDLIEDKFKYRRNDGKVFNLEACATGIKAFGIIQMLFNKGLLDKNTLVIIDEPEAHLHPQWIVEYARMIIMLHKEYGIKFFIASHNPDMISALKYISLKQNVSESLNFYLAQENEDYSFDYKALGLEIDEVFNSFNIALERINQYGVAE